MVNLQVYKIQVIKVRPYVLDSGSRQYGQDDTGDILVGKAVSTDNGLTIYLEHDLVLYNVVVPLTDQFIAYLNMVDTGSALLSKVLAMEKTEQYLESIERAGISPKLDESLKSMFGRLQVVGR